MTKPQNHKRHLYHNLKPALILLFLPVLVGFGTIAVIATGVYANNLASLGTQRLVTEGWQGARQAMLQAQPEYERKFAYYRVKEGQTVDELAAYFSVPAAKITEMNPGTIVPGTTVRIPPVEAPLSPAGEPNGLIRQAEVTDDEGVLRIRNKYRLNRTIVTTIPDLMDFLAPYQAIEQTGAGVFRINRAISIDGDIRLDITAPTVKRLELKSSPYAITCLCMDQSIALINGVTVTTYDPATGEPDTTINDGRSYVRMKNGRMDILNSTFSYLGNGLEETGEGSKVLPRQTEGGVYGVSWRISDDRLGIEIATGWVEKSKFYHNHFGAYTYGTSGMLWRNNHFFRNDVYGLDPHDDSNNALVENNVFENNGKHGFIVSKRCNYNIIRNNTSSGNGLHGFMLHQDSAYNLIENNVSYGNVDNFAIFSSNFNTIRNNKSYNPKNSHVRINQDSHNTFVMGNKMVGGKRGIYLYAGVKNVLVSDNSILGTKRELETRTAHNAVFTNNTVSALNYDIAAGDRLIFGLNPVDRDTLPAIPATAPLPSGFTLR